MQTETNFRLQTGSHDVREKGMCVMEAVAFLAGEPHSDAPVCADPVLGQMLMKLNDRATSNDRQRLLTLLPRVVGSRNRAVAERVIELLDSLYVRLLPHYDDAFEAAAAWYLGHYEEIPGYTMDWPSILAPFLDAQQTWADFMLPYAPGIALSSQRFEVAFNQINELLGPDPFDAALASWCEGGCTAESIRERVAERIAAAA